MGAWIEITILLSPSGLIKVAPYMGAWIEIAIYNFKIVHLIVAPYMGAWIEIFNVLTFCYHLRSRTLHGCVD